MIKQPTEEPMNYSSDPIRLVGRSVTVETSSGETVTGTLCSAGLGGVLLDIDGDRLELAPSEVVELDAVAQYPGSMAKRAILPV